MTPRVLRLKAADGEDLCVIAAVLQDATAPINEMVYDVAAGRFLAAFTRQRRECAAPTDACLSVLRLDHVKSVRWRGLVPDQPQASHKVLTLLEEDEGSILLVFQGGEAIRFEVERIDVHLEDVVSRRVASEETIA